MNGRPNHRNKAVFSLRISVNSRPNHRHKRNMDGAYHVAFAKFTFSRKRNFY